jgi:hypothetical protein
MPLDFFGLSSGALKKREAYLVQFFDPRKLDKMHC